MGGKRFLVLRLADGSRMRVPRHWTNANGDEGATDVPTPEDSVFTVESLRELTAVVDALLHRD
jgi:hypothetical protein